MTNEIEKVSGNISPFEHIRRVSGAGNEYWSDRGRKILDLRVLDHGIVARKGYTSFQEAGLMGR